MPTEDQLAQELRTRLHAETAGLEPSTDLLASLRRRQARRSLTTRIGIVAAPVAAAIAAVALVVSGTGGAVTAAKPPGPVHPAKSAVLTVAMVHRVTSQSQRALARSGRASIAYRLKDNGTESVSGSDKITFAGRDWNDVVSQKFPASNGQPSTTQTAIDRIVGGQFYLHTQGSDGHVVWFHELGRHGHPSVQIPDPRTLFGLLNPSAQFVVVGHHTVHGVKLTVLRATKQPKLHDLGWLPGVERGAQVQRLTVSVDSSDVVREMALSVRHVHTSSPLYLEKNKNGDLKVVVPSKKWLKKARAYARPLRKNYHVTVGVDPKLSAKVSRDVQIAKVSVAFSGFGQHQVIVVPPHAIAEHAKG